MKLDPPAAALRGFALACAVMPLAAMAAADATYSAPMNARDKVVFSTEGMQSAHPDFRWRMAGLREMEQDRIDLAQSYFRRAARYADKPAQAMLAELLWTGRGGERNPVQAYAWMDLAAERGYVMFVAHREKYWAALTQGERHAAVEFGRELYAKYGDDVAKPRLEAELQRGRFAITGSRAGGVGSVRVFQAPSYNDGGVGLSRNGRLLVGLEMPNYYDNKYWRPTQYWEWQDSLYSELPLAWRLGEVEVGDPKPPSDAGEKARRSPRESDPKPV